MEHTKHIWRAFLVLLVVGIGAIVGRHFLIPDSFGKEGFYRYDSLAEYMAKPVVHGGVSDCAPCHRERFDTKMKGKHASVSCEVCHAPMAVHATREAKIAVMPTDRSQALCSLCHQKLRARPETMPQVDLKQHLVTLGVASPGEALPDDVCLTCHDVHDPTLNKK